MFRKIINFIAIATLLICVTNAINFKQWKDCKSCTGAGYGWCPIRRMCGGFANRNCRGDHTDKAKTDEEVAEEEAEERRRAKAEREAEADSDVIKKVIEAVAVTADEFEKEHLSSDDL